MKIRILSVMNHRLTKDQKNDIKNLSPIRKKYDEYELKEIIDLPQYSEIWKNIPPEYDEVEILHHLAPLLNFIEWEYKPHTIILAGNLSACLVLMDWYKKVKDDYGWPVFYYESTTKRVSQETMLPDGSVAKKSIFKHIRFRYLK